MKEMIIKDIKAFRAAQGFVGIDDYRWPLRGVLIKPDGTVVATDGHILFIGKDVVDASGLKEAVIIEPKKLLHKYSSIASVDMEGQRIITDKGNIPFMVIKEPYVKYESAVPSGEPVEIDSIGLTARVMVKAMTALDSLAGKGQIVGMRFSFNGQWSGIRVSMPGWDNIEVVIMPARM